MLRTVAAEQVIEQAVGGRTEPYKVRCSDSSGVLIEAFIKATWEKCSRECLVREVLAALLAKDLGLPVADCVLIEFDDTFIEAARLSHQKFAQRLASSVRPAFGSIRAGDSFQMCTAVPDHYEKMLLAEIWAFDRLTLNPDRRPDKPNCLWDGKKIALIDHEMALNVIGVGLLVPPPWREGSVAEQEQRQPHLFSRNILGQELRLDALHERWTNLDPSVLDRYCEWLPSSWDCSEAAKDIAEYLHALQANIDDAFRRLNEVLR